MDNVEEVEMSDAERIAREFHRSYENLAPRFGYATRESSPVEWESVPASNKALMVATVQALLDRGVISVPEARS